MITIDGSTGEGGGQVLRTSLALAACTGQPCCVTRIRAGRARPGLQPQHLAAARAAAAVTGAVLEGAELGASVITFIPGQLAPGRHRFAVGTAGSTTLVLQTVLPALLRAPAPSHLVLTGGTHNPLAPPFPFLQAALLPLLAKMGAAVQARLRRPGFHPGGGGCVEVDVRPCARLRPLQMLHRGAVRACRATALLSQLPRHVAERELRVVQRRLGWRAEQLRIEVVDATGPGNALCAEIDCEHSTVVFSAFGARGRPAEDVANELADQVERWQAWAVPVDEQLADQLLVPLALAGDGCFRTGPLSAHATTNCAIIEQFLPVRFALAARADGSVEVSVR